MPRPFPVVSIATELTNTLRRCPDQSYIFITLVNECEKLVAFEQRAYSCFNRLQRVSHSFIDGCQYIGLFFPAISTG